MDVSDQHVWFLDDDAFEATDRPGFRRRVVDGDAMQLCFWRIQGGATGSFLHRHTDHEQWGIVLRGKLDFRIGDPESDERVVLNAGDAYLARRGVWHGDSVFIGDEEYDECWILDLFAPPRHDLSEVASGDGATPAFDRLHDV